METCKTCGKEARPFEEGVIGDVFVALSWEYVDKKEFKARKKDGRARWIHFVCQECFKKYTGEWPKSLQELNEERKKLAEAGKKGGAKSKRKITPEDQAKMQKGRSKKKKV